MLELIGQLEALIETRPDADTQISANALLGYLRDLEEFYRETDRLAEHLGFDPDSAPGLGDLVDRAGSLLEDYGQVENLLNRQEVLIHQLKHPVAHRLIAVLELETKLIAQAKAKATEVATLTLHIRRLEAHIQGKAACPQLMGLSGLLVGGK